MTHLPPLSYSLAFGPIAIYLLLLGLTNLSRRPWLVSGGRDTAALAISMFGLAVVGPFDLFMPAAAANRYGAYVWVLLAALYLLGITLVVLYQRPRLTVYNIQRSMLETLVTRLAASLDPDTSWTGKHVVMPNWGLEFTFESFPALRNASVVSIGEPTNFVAWQHFEEELEQVLRNTRVPANPRGYSFILTSLLLLGVLVWDVQRDPDSLLRDLKALLRL